MGMGGEEKMERREREEELRAKVEMIERKIEHRKGDPNEDKGNS